MKIFLAGSVALLAGIAAANAAEAPAEACQALVKQGVCVYAAALDGADSDRLGTLSQIEGRVMASGESGFTPARTDASLSIGDRVLVLEGGKATVQAGSFSQALATPAVIDASAVNGCGCLTVQSDVRTFAQAAGSAGAGAAAVQSGAGAGGAAAGAGAAGAGAAGSAGILGGTAAALGVSTTAVAIGGAVAVGAVVVGTTVAINESNNNDDTPTSP